MKMKILLLTLTFGFVFSAYSAPNEMGKEIFLSRCGSCHNVNKTLVGPALAGVDQRHSIDWIIKFVQSSQTLVKGGDKEAQALFSKFNIVMPDHPDLKEQDIKDVVAYIKTQESATDGTEKAPFARPGKKHPAYLPISISDYGYFITYFLAIGLLVGALLFFVRVKEYERANRREL